MQNPESVNSGEHRSCGHLVGTVQKVCNITESTKCWNMKLEFYCMLVTKFCLFVVYSPVSSLEDCVDCDCGWYDHVAGTCSFKVNIEPPRVYVNNSQQDIIMIKINTTFC